MSHTTYNGGEGTDIAVWELEYYETPSGESPALDFIESLSFKMQAKAYMELELLEEMGNMIPMPYSRPMGNGLYELRIQSAGNIARVFYFFLIEKKIILTNGFVKKTEKTPPGEIDRAMKYKADYEGRYGK